MPTLTSDDRPVLDEPSERSPLADVDGFLAAATLLQNPRLARTYVFVCYEGPTTVQEVIDALEVPRATAYDDIDRLESLGVVTRDERSRPHRLEAEAFAFVDDDGLAITPTVLHALALTEIDSDAASLQNRYGTGRLVRALRLAGEHYAGRLTQRMVADELGVAPAEGMAIVQSLRPALAAGQVNDPYFDRVFADISEAIDVDLDVTGLDGGSDPTDDV
jgi:predicted DNA-binding transcriptional regulator YafY